MIEDSFNSNFIHNLGTPKSSLGNLKIQTSKIPSVFCCKVPVGWIVVVEEMNCTGESCLNYYSVSVLLVRVWQVSMSFAVFPL